MPRYYEYSPPTLSDMIKDIATQSVNMPKLGKFKLAPVVQWCRSQFGVCRNIHPIYTVGIEGLHANGSLGTWAYIVHDNEIVSFWFRDYDDQILFKHTWVNHER